MTSVQIITEQIKISTSRLSAKIIVEQITAKQIKIAVRSFKITLEQVTPAQIKVIMGISVKVTTVKITLIG